MKKGVKKLIVDIPDDLHHFLKLKALNENTTIKEIVNKALKSIK